MPPGRPRKEVPQPELLTLDLPAPSQRSDDEIRSALSLFGISTHRDSKKLQTLLKQAIKQVPELGRPGHAVPLRRVRPRTPPHLPPHGADEDLHSELGAQQERWAIAVELADAERPGWVLGSPPELLFVLDLSAPKSYVSAETLRQLGVVLEPPVADLRDETPSGVATKKAKGVGAESGDDATATPAKRPYKRSAHIKAIDMGAVRIGGREAGSLKVRKKRKKQRKESKKSGKSPRGGGWGGRGDSRTSY